MVRIHLQLGELHFQVENSVDFRGQIFVVCSRRVQIMYGSGHQLFVLAHYFFVVEKLFVKKEFGLSRLFLCLVSKRLYSFNNNKANFFWSETPTLSVFSRGFFGFTEICS